VIAAAVLVAASQSGPLTGDRWALIGVAVLTLAGTAMQVRSMRTAAAEAQRTADKKVDAEAYDRARAIDQGVFDRLTGEIRALENQVSALRAELEAEERAHDATKQENTTLRQRLADVEQTVERMSRLLSAASIELPPSLDPRQGGNLDDRMEH
jgi:septal ring factor EnvC (AmiA/AmiB activator)